jgi:hypothetical protein
MNILYKKDLKKQSDKASIRKSHIARDRFFTILKTYYLTQYFPMRILCILCIIFFSTVPTYGSTYTHSDGSKVSIKIDMRITGTTKSVVDKEIEKILPKIELPTIEDQLYINIEKDTTQKIDTINWEHSIEVKMIHQDKHITSLLINSYEYTGWAHGSMSRNGIVIDNTTGNVISLNNLYNTDKFVKKLAPIWKNKIINSLEKNTESTLWNDEIKWIEEWTETINQYSSFVITPKWLIVYWQQYQHNAYAYGMQTLYYPRSKLTDTAK